MGCGTSSLNRKIKAISRPQSTVKYNKNSIAQSLFLDPDFLCSSILTYVIMIQLIKLINEAVIIYLI